MFKVKKVESFERFLDDIDLGKTDGMLQWIDRVNWPAEFPYAPQVAFAMAHDGREVFLKYIVNEECTMGLTAEDNGPVWTDSCVEFFISFDQSGYYNFEFNCIGRALLGFRKVKKEAAYAPASVMDSIYRHSTLGDQTFTERCGDNVWEIDIRIPVTAFFKHDIKDISGMTARANFYKCGDNLSTPHFLSWSPIDTPSPNFHCEQFFGELEFQE